jgi:hypothetical protein
MAPRGGKGGDVPARDDLVVAAVGPRADALTVLRAIYRDPNADLAKRLDAAKAALPYEHQRKTKEADAEGVVLNVAIELGHAS